MKLKVTAKSDVKQKINISEYNILPDSCLFTYILGLVLLLLYADKFHLISCKNLHRKGVAVV